MRRGILFTSGTQTAIQLIGLGTGVLVARLLGPDGRGQLAAVISWTTMLAYLGNFGLPVALTFASSKYPQERHQLFGNGVVIAAAQWLLLGLIGWYLLPVALAGHGSQLGRMAALYFCAYVPLNLLTMYANAIQQGSGQYGSFNFIRLSVPSGYAIVLLIFWGMHRFNVSTIVLANLLSNVLAAVLAISLVLPKLIRLKHQSGLGWFEPKSLRRDLRYGMSAQIGTLQPFNTLQIDVLALTLMTINYQLGLYMAALAAANLIRAQGFALGQVVLPEVAKRDNETEQWRVIGRFLMIASAGGTVALVVTMIWAAPLLRLIYGEAFVPAALMLRILCCAGTLGALYRVLADGLRGMGHPGVSTVAELVGFGLGIAVLIICIPLWGAAGAAVGVLVASVVSLVVATGFSIRLRGKSHSALAAVALSKVALHDPL